MKKHRRFGKPRTGRRRLAVERLEIRTLMDVAGGLPLISSEVDYLIVTTNEVTAASGTLDDFVAHKEALGFDTAVVTEDDWGGGTGDTAAENLRDYLERRYDSRGVQYVLLIGNPDPGAGELAMKCVYPRGTANACPTDYYFAALSTDWNPDGDGFFGEWADDLGRRMPEHDVLVGRIPVYTGVAGWDATLDSILQKTIDYENEVDASWRESILMPMAVLRFADECNHTNDKGHHGLAALSVDVGDFITTDVAMANGYDYHRLYEHEGIAAPGMGEAALTRESFVGYTDPATGVNSVGEWEQNPYGIVTWLGHGGEDKAKRRIWTDDFPEVLQEGQLVADGRPDIRPGHSNNEVNYWEPFIRSADNQRLDDDHPAFVIQASCRNAWPENPNNLAYSLLKNGAIGTVALTRRGTFETGDWTPDSGLRNGDIAAYTYWIPRGLAEEEIDGTPTRTIAQALAWCRENFSSDDTGYPHRKNAFAMNLYGDPSAGLFLKADLLGTRFDVVRDNLQGTGGTVEVAITVANHGQKDSFPCDLKFVLSDDTHFEPGVGGDQWLFLDPSSPHVEARERTSVNVPPLAPGETFRAGILLQVPDTDPFGTDNDYAIGMLVDADQTVVESREENNRGMGKGLDFDDVYYHATAPFPFCEGWETGRIADYWEPLPGGPTGRVQLCSDHGPYTGSVHLTMETAGIWTPTENELILHADTSGQEEFMLGFAGRAWNGESDVFDYSYNFGETWQQGMNTWPAELRNLELTDEYEYRYFLFGGPGAVHPADMLFRFRQSGRCAIPDDGIALDDVYIGPALPDLVGTSLSLRQENFHLTGSAVQTEFTIRNASPKDCSEGFHVRFYLSEDAVIDPATDQLMQIHSVDSHFHDAPDHAALRYDGLAAYAEQSDTVRLVVPQDDPFDGFNHYYLGMVVDADGEVEELVFTNHPGEENNRNQGIGMDMVDVLYVTPADAGFFENWESGRFADCWEVIPGAEGTIEITGDHGPFAGSYHVTMEDANSMDAGSLNQLILHVDLGGHDEVLLSFANREWGSPGHENDDPEDRVDISVDGGRTWSGVRALQGDWSTEHYTMRTFDLDRCVPGYSYHTLIRFQQFTDGPIPFDGFAFDDIYVGVENEGPRVVASSPEAHVRPGQRSVEFVFDEPMDQTSFDLSDVVSFLGPGGRDLSRTLRGYRWMDETTLVVEFEPATRYGTYRLTIGPDVTDDASIHNPMDQDGDGTSGERRDDRFTATFRVAEPLHFADMETDPGWQLDRGSAPFQWERGSPRRTTEISPGEAVSGEAVMGYNLSGHYADGMRETQYATTPAIDCGRYEQVTLAYYRWLGVGAAPGDQAVIQVSTDGRRWDDRWVNPSRSVVDDEWVYEEFDLSSIADGARTLYIRWGLGPTDASGTYPGWCLDDVAVYGMPEGYNLRPWMAFVQPAGDVAVPVGGTATIAWEDIDDEDAAEIQLAVTPAGSRTPWQDASARRISPLLRENPDGAGDRYEWDTSGFAPGTYTVWARIDDGVNAPVHAVAAGRVKILSDRPSEFHLLQPLGEDLNRDDPPESKGGRSKSSADADDWELYKAVAFEQLRSQEGGDLDDRALVESIDHVLELADWRS